MKISTLCASAAVLLLIACGGEGTQDSGDGEDVTVGESNAAKITAGEFELDTQPHGVASACDVHTHLSLKNDGASTATLTEVVGGACRLAVQPNLRTYQLRFTKTECGSRYYSGSHKDADGTHAITIVDHRGRICEDIVPAQIVLTETVPGPITTTKYSRDPAPVGGQAIEVTGKLIHTVGIGGENTGRSVQSQDETVELILDEGEQNQFQEGATARVKGTVKFLNGVETHNRKAIDVTEMLLCPTMRNVDCMPGPDVRLSNYCSSGNRSWVTKNCPGVTFTD
jgi:hypothetical protein